MQELEIFNRMQSAAQITSAIIGVNGTVGGSPDYQNNKFGPGIHCDATGEKAIFSLSDGILNAFMLEWYQTTDFSVTNGVPDDGVHHYFFDITSSIHASTFAFICYNIGGTGLVQYGSQDGGTLGNNATEDWTAGDLLHFLYVVDRAASFDATKTTAIFLNGVELLSDTGALTDKSAATTTVLHMDGSVPGTFDAASTISPLKVYPYVGNIPLILASRERERFCLNDSLIIT